MKVARLTLSDRAGAGVYEDLSGPEIERVLTSPGVVVDEWVRLVIPGDQAGIEHALQNSLTRNATPC